MTLPSSCDVLADFCKATLQLFRPMVRVCFWCYSLYDSITDLRVSGAFNINSVAPTFFGKLKVDQRGRDSGRQAYPSVFLGSFSFPL